jgi:hypothetical protein
MSKEDSEIQAGVTVTVDTSFLVAVPGLDRLDRGMIDGE